MPGTGDKQGSLEEPDGIQLRRPPYNPKQRQAGDCAMTFIPSLPQSLRSCLAPECETGSSSRSPLRCLLELLQLSGLPWADIVRYSSYLAASE